jgi:hypothetical protein
MSKIIDLGLLVKEPLIFKDVEGTKYTIPGQISTKFVLKFSYYEQESKKIKNADEGIQKLEQMVADILNLDTSKEIDVQYVQDKFDDVRFLKAIVHGFGNHLYSINQDPNFDSPESEK